MKRDNDSPALRIAAVVFVLMACAVLGNCVGNMARATDDDERGVSPSAELALARLCVNEAGMRAYQGDDCAAIHTVIQFRADHIYRSSYLTALHRYSHGVTTAARSARGVGRPWVAELEADGRAPRSWAGSTRASWARSSRHWLRTYAHAREIYRTDARAECYGTTRDGAPILTRPHTWTRSDVRPADTSAQALDCGSTRNVFWSVPRYARLWGS